MSRLTKFAPFGSFLLALTLVLTGTFGQSSAKAESYETMGHLAYINSNAAALDSLFAYDDYAADQPDDLLPSDVYLFAKRARDYAHRAYISAAGSNSEYAYYAFYYADLALKDAKLAYMCINEGDIEDALVYWTYVYKFSTYSADYSYFVYLGY